MIASVTSMSGATVWLINSLGRDFMRRKLAITTAISLASALALGACGGGASYSKEKFCAAAEDVDKSGDDISDALDAGDPKDLEKALDRGLADVEATVAIAPEEIKEAMTLVLDKQQEFAKILKKADYDLTEVDAEVLTEFSADKKFERARDDIDDFLLDECDIEPDEDQSADSVAPEDTAPPVLETVAPVVPLDTVAPIDTAAPADPGVLPTVDPATAALIPDYETFVKFAALGNGVELTAEQTACAVSELESRLTLEELQIFIDLPEDQIPEDKSIDVGLSFVNCDITFPT
jgi:hypothetical protein